MKYKFYGTAAAEGIPAIFCECETCKRAWEKGGKNIMTRSQSVIDDTLGIDFPADTYLHILNYGLPVTDISTFIITHKHSDHFYVNDFFMHSPGYAYVPEDKEIDIYTTKLGYDYAAEALVGAFGVSVRCHLIEDFVPFVTKEGYKVTPLKADHCVDAVIFLIEKDGKCVLHSNDTGYYPKETWDWLEKNRTYINFAEFDCTMCGFNTENDRHHNHSNFSTVENIKRRLEKMGCINEQTICVLNHFSHNYGMIYDDLKKYGDAKGYLTAYDGLEVNF
ncbi:MAG: hypothetical protein IKW64_00945 [Clostridia bacterium]|nr:hypothetical protein [Clostridia bacterium]